MHHIWLKFKQEIPVFRIIFGGFDIIPSKGLDGFKILPEGERDKVGDGALAPFENMNADIAFHGLIVRDGAGVQEFAIGSRFRSGYLSMPNSDDHLLLFFENEFSGVFVE